MTAADGNSRAVQSHRVRAVGRHSGDDAAYGGHHPGGFVSTTIAEQRARIRRLPLDGLLIGRNMLPDWHEPFGFVGERTELSAGKEDLVVDRGEGHVMTVAPTGAGKGLNVTLPALLAWQGPSITVDVKGEAARVAGPHLARCGHQVVVIDWFGELDPIRVAKNPVQFGGFNPMDTLDPDSPSFAADCNAFFATIQGSQPSHQDRFWHATAHGLGTGTVGLIRQYFPPETRNLFGLRKFLCDGDLDYRIAVQLDTILADSQCFIAQEFKNYLGHEGEKVRTSVRSTAIQDLTVFAGDHLRSVTGTTSFSLDAVTEGKPLSIFLVVPPHRIESAAVLLRLTVATLLGLITRRKLVPLAPTLVVLDELAQFGTFPLLRQIVTLMRGYGVRAMLMLQDLSQLRQLYPSDYQTIVNNCSILSTFGHSSYSMSREFAELMGDISADTLFDMGRDVMAVRFAGQHTRILKRLNYLTDPLFAGLYGANPLGRRQGQTMSAADF